MVLEDKLCMYGTGNTEDLCNWKYLRIWIDTSRLYLGTSFSNNVGDADIECWRVELSHVHHTVRYQRMPCWDFCKFKLAFVFTLSV